MDGNTGKKPGRHICEAAEKIKDIQGIFGRRLGISKAIALAERERLPLGAPNINDRSDDQSEAIKAIKAIRDSCNRIHNEITQGDFAITTAYAKATNGREGLIQALAYSKGSKEHKMGNCYEQCCYVYCKLYKMEYFPIEMVSIKSIVLPIENHIFVAIGLDQGGKKGTLDDLKGNDVVICDPWLMMLLENREKKQTDGAYTLEQFLGHIGPYIRDGDRSIKREHRLEKA